MRGLAPCKHGESCKPEILDGEAARLGLAAEHHHLAGVGILADATVLDLAPQQALLHQLGGLQAGVGRGGDR